MTGTIGPITSRRVPRQRPDPGCSTRQRSTRFFSATLPPQIAQAFSSVMALQVRPGSTQPFSPTGHEKSAEVIGRRPAYSIRARGFAPQSEAGCMAAISSCDPETQKGAWQRGASMYGSRVSQPERATCRDMRRARSEPWAGSPLVVGDFPGSGRCAANPTAASDGDRQFQQTSVC
jgi:hypothetical protein